MAIPPPGPNGAQLSRVKKDFQRVDIVEFLAGLTKEYGDVVRFNFGSLPCILVNGAPLVRKLFSEREACLRKPEFVKDSNRGHWGDGLTTLEGTAWQARRRILLPSFRAMCVAPRLAVVAQCTEDMLDAWTPKSQTDLLKELRILTARIAARMLLNAELEGHGPSAGRSGVLPFSEAYGEDYVSTLRDKSMAPLFMVRPRASRRMDVTVGIIDERLASGEQNGDVLSGLILHGATLTRNQILGEVIQMLYAGHLTIPYSLVSLWREIAANGLASKITSEANHLCTGAVPDMAALSTSYCFAALKESMRLHPPAPILYREVESIFELNGFEFAPNAAVWVSPHLLHTDGRYFPEPDRFLPERFMMGSCAAAAQSPYLPFGAGRRTCIANHLALHQMTLITLLTARRFQFTAMRDA